MNTTPLSLIRLIAASMDGTSKMQMVAAAEAWLGHRYGTEALSSSSSSGWNRLFRTSNVFRMISSEPSRSLLRAAMRLHASSSKQDNSYS
jgi:hypothetical protein